MEAVVNPDDIARILDELGQRLGPSGEYVFELAVRQVYIEAAIGLVSGGVFLLVVGIASWKVWTVLRREWAKPAESYHTKDFVLDVGFPGGIAGGALGLAAAFSALLVTDALPKLLNPEYAALTDILSRIVP